MQLFAFMHPTGSYLSAVLREFTLPIIIGWPTETSVAVTRLIFSGVLERIRTQTRVAHGGGTLPYLLAGLTKPFLRLTTKQTPRVALTSRSRPAIIATDPFDTAVLHPKTLHFLIEEMERITFFLAAIFLTKIGYADRQLLRLAVYSLRAQPAATRSRDHSFGKNQRAGLGKTECLEDV